MLALYMDQHVPRAITEGLRLRRIDVTTAYEDDASDMEIRNYWIVLVNWDACFSHKMMTFSQRLLNDKEKEFLLME